ncbi:MAG: homocysteine S-methyltransferase family protein [Spirochaeta sp.]|jgi:S-methylmethionine-dependent homocysteine/selenocysteine methylase|nr:homocysteine S-methyltransferase family protein [Spirochaeta sp.]
MDSIAATDALAARLTEGPPVLIDGGTGTELERMGATLHKDLWSARAALTDPEILRQVHSAYIDAGAEIIIANTYSCNYHLMVSAGLPGEFDAANREALKLALAARDAGKTQPHHQERPVWVAGSMSTTTLTTGLERSVIAEAGDPGDGYRAQAEIIADVGVDLIMLEMMRDVTQTRLCLDAAMETALPVWLGFSADRGPQGGLCLYGSQTPFKEGVARVLDGGGTPQAVGVMHSDTELIPEALQALGEVWDGPVYAYPHHGVFEIPNWRFDNTLSPDEFTAAAMEWVAHGARAVGGCCGVRPGHIAALRSAIDQAYR